MKFNQGLSTPFQVASFTCLDRPQTVYVPQDTEFVGLEVLTKHGFFDDIFLPIQISPGFNTPHIVVDEKDLNEVFNHPACPPHNYVIQVKAYRKHAMA